MQLIKLYSSPTVFILATESTHNKGDVVEYTTKYGKEIELEIFKFLGKKNNLNQYSYLRLDGKSRKTVLEAKIEKRLNWAETSEAKSDAYLKAAREGDDIIPLGQPVLTDHYSAKRHRALLARNHKRMDKCVEYSAKADNHKIVAENIEAKLKKELPIDTPECLPYIQEALEQATAHHKYLKENKEAREHAYSLTYANKKVKDLTARLDRAKHLWEI